MCLQSIMQIGGNGNNNRNKIEILICLDEWHGAGTNAGQTPQPKAVGLLGC